MTKHALKTVLVLADLVTKMLAQKPPINFKMLCCFAPFAFATGSSINNQIFLRCTLLVEMLSFVSHFSPFEFISFSFCFPTVSENVQLPPPTSSSRQHKECRFQRHYLSPIFRQLQRALGTNKAKEKWWRGLHCCRNISFSISLTLKWRVQNWQIQLLSKAENVLKKENRLFHHLIQKIGSLLLASKMQGALRYWRNGLFAVVTGFLPT